MRVPSRGGRPRAFYEGKTGPPLLVRDPRPSGLPQGLRAESALRGPVGPGRGWGGGGRQKGPRALAPCLPGDKGSFCLPA